MKFIFLIYVFIFGTCIASFMNVIIFRLPLGISIAKGRSFCPCCHHQLNIYDLIPIVSYIFLFGKCRYCHTKISIHDTCLEIFGGLLSLFCLYHYGINIMALFVFCFGMLLLTISLIDLKIMIIPDCLVLSCFVIGMMSIPFMNLSLLDRIFGFFVISCPLYILNLFIPDCFGGGDIKLIAVCGLMLGWKLVLVGMFIAVIIAGCYAGYLMLTHKVDKKGHIAFGPYICFGMFVSLLYGNELLSWYLALFGL